MADFKGHEEGKGRAFKNEKDGNDSRPDYTGTFKYRDEVVKISMWHNEQYDSYGLSIQEDTYKKPEPQNDNPFDKSDSEIPF